MSLKGTPPFMLYMLCRNRVRDFETWKAVFFSRAEAHHRAGLNLLYLWRSANDPNNVFFLFKVENRERALAFVNDPVGAEAGKTSGVIDGEIRLLDQIPGY
jgi:hypothetical protein